VLVCSATATDPVPGIDLTPPSVSLFGVRAGDQVPISVTITRAGQPFDLTGWTVTAQARATPAAPDPALQAAVTVSDAAAGKLLLMWPGDDVRVLLAGADHWTGVWDLQVDDGAMVMTLLQGRFRADMDVTR
jgi:hypothetical protein